MILCTDGNAHEPFNFIPTSRVSGFPAATQGEFMTKKHTESSKGSRFFADGHVDLPYLLMKDGYEGSFKDLEEGPFTFHKAKDAGVRFFCTALYCQDLFNGEKSFRHYQQVLAFARRALESLNLLKDQKDLEALEKPSDDMGTLFLLENADCLADDFSRIDRLREDGVFAVGLTHAGENRLGDGNNIRFSEGLTDAGKGVVRALRENRILLDVAHLHPVCFQDLLDMVETPIMSSHTGIREVFDIQRNISLRQAGEIFQRKGMVGITLNPEMLAPEGKAEVASVFAHLDTVVQKFGSDGVGIGSDFCGFDVPIKGMEDISGISLLVEELINHGYDRRAIEKIMGRNWLDIFSRILAQ